MTHFSQNILGSLKDAVVKVFWKKDDLRALFEVAEVPQSIINAQNWDLYKFKIVSPVLDKLNSTATGIGPLRRILHETLSFKDGNHLLWCSDGQRLKREAEESLARLRSLVADHDGAKQTEKEQQQAIARRKEEANKHRAFNEKLAELKAVFIHFHGKADHNERGYDLETLLNELFRLFDMTPRAPFKRTGEQIDGSFVLDRDHYLLEAKWQKKPVDLADLRDLDGAVGSSLDNTLGLLVSIEGFNDTGIVGYLQGSRPRLVCMDGADLFMVLDGRIDLADLLQRKKDIAVQKKKINVSANDIILGRS
jgi:Restriction endonuclease